MLLTDICRFVQLILLLSHFQSAPRVFLWDDKHWVASLHIFRRADIIQGGVNRRRDRELLKAKYAKRLDRSGAGKCEKAL